MPAICAGCFFKRSQLKYVSVLLLIAAFVEVLLLVLSKWNYDNWMLAHGFMILETFLVGIGMSQLLQDSLRKVLSISILVIGVLLIILRVLNLASLMMYIQNFTLLFLLSYVLYDFVSRKMETKLLKNGLFWLIFGFWFFFLCNSLMLLLVNVLVGSSGSAFVFNVFTNGMAIINMATYGILTFGVVYKHER